MRILVVGSGGVGSAFAPIAARRDFYEHIVFSDIDELRRQNLGAILEAAGSSLDRLVKTTVFLVDLNDFAGMNEVYARHVGARPPARSTIEVSKLPSGALLEIEAIAHV